MSKPKGRNKGKKYERPLSLYPMKFEDAVKVIGKARIAKPFIKPKRGKKGKG